MKGLIVIAVVALAGVGLVIVKKRRQPRGAKATMRRLRRETDQAVREIEAKVKKLRKQATHLSGEAKQRVQEQAHDLEGKQRQLKEKVDDLQTEARKVIEQVRSH